MGLEELKKEILDKAKVEANTIINQGRKEAQEIIKTAEEKSEEYAQKVKAETKELLNRIEMRELATARFDTKKALFEKKTELINAVFAKAKEKLKKLPSKERERFIKTLIDRAKKEIALKTVYANTHDKKFVAKIPGITYKHRDMLGGIIGETEDKSVNVDYSFEQLLGSVREKYLQDIAKKLFR